MSARDFGNAPLWSTTAGTGTDPSTTTVIAQIIIPTPQSSVVACQYEVRYVIGASTGGFWRLECATDAGLSTGSIRAATNDSTAALQRSLVFTGSNQTSEFVLTQRAYQGDRFRILAQSSFTGTYAGSIQAEPIT